MKIGFACKYVHPHSETLRKKEIKEIEQSYNGKSTTAAWLRRQDRKTAETKILEIAEYNARAAYKLVDWVGQRRVEQRMLRLGSDLVPMYTHAEWAAFWQDTTIQKQLESWYKPIGERARELGVRLSFHPGQFVVLASDRPEVVESSIAEFEYHADLIRFMGYGKKFQDFKCNVHISGKQGPAGVRKAYARLSLEARNSITIENEEMRWGLDSVLELSDIIPVVLDIHHHWIHSEGEYIQPGDSRFQQVVDSWQGIRPVIHYSVSRDEYIGRIPQIQLPDYQQLLSKGYKKSKLRAHSNWYRNTACNDWALSFLPHADIMCESKMKILASTELVDYWRATC